MNHTPLSILRITNSRLLVLCALFASILIFSGSTSAELRISSWGESSSNSQLGNDFREKAPITENGQTYTANVEISDQYVRANTKISEEGIEQDVEMSWGIPISGINYASSNVTIDFELTEPMYYALSGQASFNDPYGSATGFEATLVGFPSESSSIQLSRGDVQPDTYILGEERGNHENTMNGSLRGVLYAGTYRLVLRTYSSDYGDAEVSNIVSEQMDNPLSPPSAPVQRRLQGPHAKSNFLAVRPCQYLRCRFDY